MTPLRDLFAVALDARLAGDESAVDSVLAEAGAARPWFDVLGDPECRAPRPLMLRAPRLTSTAGLSGILGPTEPYSDQLFVGPFPVPIRQPRFAVDASSNPFVRSPTRMTSDDDEIEIRIRGYANEIVTGPRVIDVD